jgi:hypothetical protein
MNFTRALICWRIWRFFFNLHALWLVSKYYMRATCLSDFDVKLWKGILVILIHVDICSEKTWFEEQMMVYVRRAVSRPVIGPGKFHLFPLFLSVLRYSTDFAPCPAGSKVPVNIYTLCQPLSLSYFGSPCILSWTNSTKYWRSFGHCFARIWWTWRRSSILEFSSFRE